LVAAKTSLLYPPVVLRCKISRVLFVLSLCFATRNGLHLPRRFS
jgi:hypothetical protein